MATDSMEATAAPSFSPVFDNIACVLKSCIDCADDDLVFLPSSSSPVTSFFDDVTQGGVKVANGLSSRVDGVHGVLHGRSSDGERAQATATDKCALAEASPSLATDRLALDAAAVTETSAQLQHVAAGATEGVPSIRDAGIAASQATRNGKLLTNAAARGCKSHPATRAVTPDKSVLRDSSVSTQTTQTSCDLPHTSTLDKVGSGGDVTAPTSQTDIFATYSRNDKLEVFDPQFRCVYDVPVRCVRHLPPARLNITRLVLCRNYRPYSTTSCVMGENCKFVHADCDYSTLASRSIHVNYIWSHEDLCTYERLPPGENVEIHFSGGNVTHIASQFLLVTAGVAARHEAVGPLTVCPRYYVNGICYEGVRCFFVHPVVVDATVPRSYRRASHKLKTMPRSSNGTFPLLPSDVCAAVGDTNGCGMSAGMPSSPLSSVTRLAPQMCGHAGNGAAVTCTFAQSGVSSCADAGGVTASSSADSVAALSMSPLVMSASATRAATLAASTSLRLPAGDAAVPLAAAVNGGSAASSAAAASAMLLPSSSSAAAAAGMSLPISTTRSFASVPASSVSTTVNALPGYMGMPLVDANGKAVQALPMLSSLGAMQAAAMATAPPLPHVQAHVQQQQQPLYVLAQPRAPATATPAATVAAAVATSKQLSITLDLTSETMAMLSNWQSVGTVLVLPRGSTHAVPLGPVPPDSSAFFRLFARST